MGFNISDVNSVGFWESSSNQVVGFLLDSTIWFPHPSTRFVCVWCLWCYLVGAWIDLHFSQHYSLSMWEKFTSHKYRLRRNGKHIGLGGWRWSRESQEVGRLPGSQHSDEHSRQRPVRSEFCVLGRGNDYALAVLFGIGEEGLQKAGMLSHSG